MLTEEQIKSWRHVLCLQFGPYAFLMSVSEIEAYRDRMQQGIDKVNVHIWHIRVRFDEKIPWEEIQPEPKNPECSLYDLRYKCQELLSKYPKIDSIQIFDPMDLSDAHIFSREKIELADEAQGYEWTL